jgi:hypothetical protein
MPVPMLGQGTPLPNGFGYQGEWLFKPGLFLYRDDPKNPLRADVEVTPEVEWEGTTALALTPRN